MVQLHGCLKLTINEFEYFLIWNIKDYDVMNTLEPSNCKEGKKVPTKKLGNCGRLKVLMIGLKWAWVTPLIIYDQFGTIQHLQMSPFPKPVSEIWRSRWGWNVALCHLSEENTYYISFLVGTFLPFITAIIIITALEQKK